MSTRQQDADRQLHDLLAAGVRRDDVYVDSGVSGVSGVSGGRASRPQFDRAVAAIKDGDTLAITTLDRLGRSTQNMLTLAEALRGRGAGLRVLNLGGGDVDTHTPMGSTVFTLMAAIAAMTQRELEIKGERITDSVARRREGGKELGGPMYTSHSRTRRAHSSDGEAFVEGKLAMSTKASPVREIASFTAAIYDHPRGNCCSSEVWEMNTRHRGPGFAPRAPIFPAGSRI